MLYNLLKMYQQFRKLWVKYPWKSDFVTYASAVIVEIYTYEALSSCLEVNFKLLSDELK